jgi:hypothetical protein
MPVPGSLPTGLGNQEGGGDEEGIWEARERKGEERGWRWARINRRRLSTCSLPLFLEAEVEKAVYRLSRS